jgi:quinoprotein glucose dehydrogenase
MLKGISVFVPLLLFGLMLCVPGPGLGEESKKQSETQAMQMTKWSGKLNVPDPVAVAVDPQGRVYVAATTRRKVADLDIREHQEWIPDDVGLNSVEAKREFYHRELAPGKWRRGRGSLVDHNKDGSVDWKDLTVHTERIYQLRDEDGDGIADRMTVFAEGFNTEVTGIAAGVLYHDGWVYVTVAPDLWRLKDTDDDGVADVREVVAHGFGMHIAYAGHDMHGPVLGPDGRIYWSIGDKGVNVTSKEGRHFYYPHEGAVMRVEPDGSGFEVFAHGLRNVQQVAFDAWGRILGVDNDADMKGEKERVVYVVEGSDAGWRCGHQYMGMNSRWYRENLWQPAHEGQPLYLLPPVELSRNGPAGFVWEPGAALEERWRGKFLLSQFPSGVISALTLEESSSASYVQTAIEDVNTGVMAIEMDWGPEGTVYLADWDGGYPLDEKGGVWKMDAVGASPSGARAEAHELLRGEFKKESAEELIVLLGHVDQRVRLGAQLELVKRGHWVELAKVARDSSNPELKRVHAVWGLGIGMRRGLCAADAALELLKDQSWRVREQAAKVLGDAPKAVGKHAARLLSLLEDDSAWVRVQTALALGKLQVPQAKTPLMAMAERDGADVVLRHAAVMGLAGCAKPSELAALANEKSKWVRAAALLALRQQRAPEVAVFLNDADAALVNEAAQAIHDDAGAPAVWPQLAALMEKPEALHEATLRRAINAGFRLGGLTEARRVVAIALNDQIAGELRLEALGHLADWTNPPRLDKVDGTSRDGEQRETSGAKEAVSAKVEALLALQDAKLKAAAILALVKLEVPVEAKVMALVVRDGVSSAEVRAEALKLMASQHGNEPELLTLLKEVWEQKMPEAVKLAALEIEVKLQPAEFAARLEPTLKNEKSLAVKQRALALAAEVAAPGRAAVVKEVAAWMNALMNDKVADDWMLDLLDCATQLAEADDSLKTLLAAFEASRPAPSIGANGMPVMPLQKELLHGGNKKRGGEIVAEHLAANCLACHVVDSGAGSSVGPSLHGIADTKSREYLLEALVNPPAVIAPGYGTVSVMLKDGSSVTGGLLKETAEEVRVRGADGKEVRLKREQIATLTPPISVMPPMVGLLNKKEIRDVVEYLASLKKTQKKASKNEH